MNQKILPLVAAGVLVLASISIVRTQPTTETNPPPTEPPRTTFGHRVAATGLVEPCSENVSIASHLPGVVERVLVVVGQDVTQGTPLVLLDTRALKADQLERQSDVAVREAGVQSAAARARRARAALADVQRHRQFAESISDPRSLSAEEITRRRSAVEIAEADVQTADADVAAAEASVVAARAALDAVNTDLQRSTITAPIAGRVLQVRIRPGEYATAGPTPSPWLVLGDVSVLHVRVDIDEHEAWRVRDGAPASAQVRGNANLRAEARFVRFEPLVVPKQSLTGASNERVDTRVLQAIYRIDRSDVPLTVGQQLDVFIEAEPLQSTLAKLTKRAKEDTRRRTHTSGVQP